MTIRTSAPLSALVLAGAAIFAAALAETPPDQDGRYSLSPADGGFVRLDRQTGTMTFCKNKDDRWQCDTMADGDEALRKEVERLENENKALNAQKKHLEDMLGMADPANPAAPGDGAAPPPGGTMKVPTEQDVDQMFDYIEGMVKKFKERIERLEKKADEAQPL